LLTNSLVKASRCSVFIRQRLKCWRRSF